MMPLNFSSSIDVHRNAHRFAGLRRSTFQKRRAMNENVASFLRIDHPQFADFGSIVSRHVQQSTIANLPAHLRVKRRLIDNHIQLVRFISRQNRIDHCLRFKKIVS